MRHSIPYHIREHLRENRSVYVPGLGMFELRLQPATIMADRSAVTPPSMALVFTEAEGSEATLLERITKVENFPMEKARKKLSKYTDKVFNKLLNLNAVEIEGIGTLVREKDEVIRFEDAVLDLTDEIHGLPTLKLKPIKRIVESDSANNGEPKPQNINDKLAAASQSAKEHETGEPTPSYLNEPEKPKKGSPWWIPLMGGIILALGYILFLQTCGSGNESKGMFGGLFADEKDIVSEDLSEIDESDAETTADGEAAVADAESKVDDEPGSDIGDEDAGDAASIDAPAVSGKGGASINNVGANKSAASRSYSKGNSVIRSAAGNASCVIIVGSFIKPKNALKMMTKVEDLGYNTYSSQYGSYTRVGLQFTCAEEDLDAYITEAKDVLEKQAWYLESPGK